MVRLKAQVTAWKVNINPMEKRGGQDYLLFYQRETHSEKVSNMLKVAQQARDS